MQELSLNILDIVQNSIRAGASLVEIAVDKQTADNRMTITIRDDGCGMTEEQVKRVENPFFTTRTTRPVGLGVPLFKMSAEMTGGSFAITSRVGKGTTVCAVYVLDHIDLMPLGDMASTMATLISVNADMDFVYTYTVDGHSFCLDTREVKEILAGVAVNSPEVLAFVREFVEENTRQVEAEHTQSLPTVEEK